MRVLDIIALKEDLDIRPMKTLGADGKPAGWEVFDTDNPKKPIQTYTGKDAEGRAEEFRDAERAKRNPKPAKPKPESLAPTEEDKARWRQRKIDNIVRADRITLTILKFLGIADAMWECWQDLDGIDEDYRLGKYGDPKTPEAKDRRDYRKEFIYGSFHAQWILPIVARAIANIEIYARLARFLNWVSDGAIVVGGFGVAGAWAAAAKHVTIEVLIQFLQYWLGTQAGKEWLASWMDGLMRTVGLGHRASWDFLAKQFKDWQGKRDPDYKPDPPKAGDVNLPSDMSKYKEGDAIVPINPKVKFVSGIQVTDDDGYLIPGIEKHTKVKVAIMNAIDAGKPSPLDGIPRRPN